MRGIRTSILAGMIWLVAVGGARTVADSHGLLCDVRPVATTVRSGAAVPLIVNLHWQGQGLLEGRLELTLRDSRNVLAVVHSHDMALTTGEQSFHFLLPPIRLAEAYVQLEVDAAFHTADKRLPLSSFLLRAPGAWERSFVVCVSEPRLTQRTESRQDFIEALSFEQFHTEDDRSLFSSAAVFEPNDMPTDPLRYCAYDLVLLHGDGFTQLSRKSLEAVRQWVQAGGSVCIVAPADSSSEQIRFLNDLVDDEPFFIDAAGKMAVATAGESPGPFLVRDGLGRAAVFVKNEKLRNFNAPEWREAVAFLWKIRADQMPAVRTVGQWDSVLLERKRRERQEEMRQLGYYNGMQGNLHFSLVPIQTGGLLVRHLMPSDIQLVPLSLMAAILGLYVLVIGPGDYLLLGRLRLRKFTWVLFPTVTIGFTFLGIALSHAYLQTADNRRALEFLDIGDDGQVVRRNRFELLFFSLPRAAETHADGSLFSAMNHQLLGTVYDPYQFSPQYREPALVGPPSYSGRVPFRYTVAQQVPQWTPQLNRMLSIGPTEAAVRFDWNSLDLRELESTAGRARIAARLIEAFGNDATVCMFHRGRLEFRIGSHPLTGQSHSINRYGRAIQTTFLEECCIRPEAGLFFLASQISPRGGDNFEDLALMDPSDPNQWLIAVVTERGDDTLIYRKLIPLPGGE